ncbi:MAG: radical SAM protein [Desulfuromonadales bacterium]|jgi:putative pyruvate formate lyase activating enzyme
MFEAAYLTLSRHGTLAGRAAEAAARLADCDLCANHCHVNRIDDPSRAVCRTGAKAIVSSVGPHYGEERPISGRRGSGTIFFGHCNLACVFCQNWPLSHRGEGRPMDSRTLANQMLSLQSMGCHNINFVSASHVIPQILAALVIAVGQGLKVPLVFNSGGYDSPQGLALLDGIIDIYMPDMKFADSALAGPYLGVNDYAEANRAAVRAMHRQVGDLVIDDTGIARRGLLIRHLLLPDDLAGTAEVLAFLAKDISPQTYVNLMEQYRPCYRADRFPALDHRPARQDFRRARAQARQLGLQRLD